MKQAKPLTGKPKFSAFSAGGKIPAHFFGANGFPVECYTPLLNSLSQRFDLNSLWHRPLWPGQTPPDPVMSWQDHATDLIQFLKSRQSEPVVAIGHSIGATATLLAAQRQPKLFSRLVLIEPVLQPSWKVSMTHLLPRALLQYIDPVKTTLSAPEQWASKAKAIEYYQQHAAYKRIPAKYLNIMIDAMLEPVTKHGEEVQLRYSRAAEAINYMGLTPVQPAFMQVKVPYVVLQGKPNLFCDQKLMHKVQQAKPDNIYFQENDYGHLIPLETPELTQQLILSGLHQLNS